jgi:hypothetical protein
LTRRRRSSLRYGTSREVERGIHRRDARSDRCSFPAFLTRIDAIVGEKGRSKFIRDAVRQVLDGANSADTGPPYLEHNGRHEARLTSSGTAVLLRIIARHGFDDMMKQLRFTDPEAFLYALLGFRPLPDRATGILVAELLPKI